MGSPDDLYALLGVGPDANLAELRRAFRRLALRWHPDRAGAAATATFQRILAAYTLLCDPRGRAAYDRTRPPRPPAAPPPPRRPAPGIMLRRLSGPLDTLVALGVARRAAGDAIELYLNAEEAAQGGMATISMRVPVRCPCDGGPCDRCGSRRTFEELFSAWLAIPPDVAEGAVLTPTVLLPGMLRPVSFRVRFSTRRAP